jgi:hypothetical protein
MTFKGNQAGERLAHLSIDVDAIFQEFKDDWPSQAIYIEDRLNRAATAEVDEFTTLDVLQKLHAGLARDVNVVLL